MIETHDETDGDSTTHTSADSEMATELRALEDKHAGMSGDEPAKREVLADKMQQTPQQVPSLGRTVIVREDGKKDAPGIVAEVFEDTISCNVFRADHLTHVATHLTQISAESGGTGWFWPPRV